MYEDRLTERQTKVGLVAHGDLAVITTVNGETRVALFTALYEGSKKSYITFNSFSPNNGAMDTRKMSWDEFEKNIIKCSVIGKLEVSKHHWTTFVDQYRNHLLIEKAERQRQYHTATT